MKKATKVLILQFLCFAAIFLLARFLIVQLGVFSGLLIPIVSGVLAIVLSPQFKVLKIEGKEKVFMAWLFSKKGKPVDWL